MTPETPKTSGEVGRHASFGKEEVVFAVPPGSFCLFILVHFRYTVLY